MGRRKLGGARILWQNLAPKFGRLDRKVVEDPDHAASRSGGADGSFHVLHDDVDRDRGDRLDVPSHLAQINANKIFRLQLGVQDKIGPHGFYDERHFRVHDGPTRLARGQILGEHD